MSCAPPVAEPRAARRADVPLGQDRRRHARVARHAAPLALHDDARRARVHGEAQHRAAGLGHAPTRVDRAEAPEELPRRPRARLGRRLEPRHVARRPAPPARAPSARDRAAGSPARRAPAATRSRRACRGAGTARAASCPRAPRAAPPTRGSPSRRAAAAAPTTAPARPRAPARVDDRDDALDRDRRLGDVRREDHLAPRAPGGRRCPAPPATGPRAAARASRSASAASFSQASRARRISPAPGKEDEDVAVEPLGDQASHGGGDLRGERAVVGLREVLDRRRRSAAPRSAGPGAARCAASGAVASVALIATTRRSGRASAAQALDERERDVPLQVPLVELVEHDHRDAGEVGRREEPSPEHPLGHEADARPRARDVLEAHLVADRAAHLLAQLLGHASRRHPRREPARLEDDDLALRRRAPRRAARAGRASSSRPPAAPRARASGGRAAMPRPRAGADRWAATARGARYSLSVHLDLATSRSPR